VRAVAALLPLDELDIDDVAAIFRRT